MILCGNEALHSYKFVSLLSTVIVTSLAEICHFRPLVTSCTSTCHLLHFHLSPLALQLVTSCTSTCHLLHFHLSPLALPILCSMIFCHLSPLQLGIFCHPWYATCDLLPPAIFCHLSPLSLVTSATCDPLPLVTSATCNLLSLLISSHMLISIACSLISLFHLLPLFTCHHVSLYLTYVMLCLLIDY